MAEVTTVRSDNRVIEHWDGPVQANVLLKRHQDYDWEQCEYCNAGNAKQNITSASAASTKPPADEPITEHGMEQVSNQGLGAGDFKSLPDPKE